MSHYQIENFLDSQENLDLLESAIKLKDYFVPTTTSTNEKYYRQSLILFSLPPTVDRVLSRISQMLPLIIDKLQISKFDVTQTECQMTAHNDGHYYKIHNDNGSEDACNRVLTYVYYFHSHPKAFNDGQLKIYGGVDSIIEPVNNSIVFFESSLMHEVLPITCASKAFRNGRFTINGWLRN